MNEPMHPVQIEGLRRMTPAQKVRMVCDLYNAGIRLRVAGLRMQHADWPRGEAGVRGPTLAAVCRNVTRWRRFSSRSSASACLIA
ncbi:MAG: hypothetical protein U1F67_16660 [Rubrivivax sp.]